MKRPQRDFVVELKSPRRAKAATTKSIWGNLDLKTVSAAIETEMPESEDPAGIQDAIPPISFNAEMDRILTPSAKMPESDVLEQERSMADETTENANAEGATADIAAKVAEPKKQRAKRGSKTAASSADADVSSDASASSAAKGRKQTRNTRTKPAATDAKPARTVRQLRAATVEVPQAALAPTSAADEMNDLLQLEQENQKLRKLLGEKLRAENADLRKRLGVS